MNLTEFRQRLLREGAPRLRKCKVSIEPAAAGGGYKRLCVRFAIGEGEPHGIPQVFSVCSPAFREGEPIPMEETARVVLERAK